MTTLRGGSNASLLLGLLAGLASGCAGRVGFDPDDGGTQRDGGRPPARLESCGNGMDDDHNGRIDDGCPCGPGETQTCFGGDYPSRGVGTCAEGVQTCAVPAGREWGDWGDFGCEGDVVPASEQCDGLDHDCDGQRDEGCPCTDGMTRDCGGEFPAVPPCRAGVQRCTAGVWGTDCEGAVGPRAETCSNGVDDDCDGVVDPPALCACAPVPEVCGNGVDDDCDGSIDEPACASTCPDALSCRDVAESSLPLVDPGAAAAYVIDSVPMDCGLGLLTQNYTLTPSSVVLQVARIALDGTFLGQTEIFRIGPDTPVSFHASNPRSSIAWNGRELLALHTEWDAAGTTEVSLNATRVGADGTLLGALVLDSEHGAESGFFAAWNSVVAVGSRFVVVRLAHPTAIPGVGYHDIQGFTIDGSSVTRWSVPVAGTIGATDLDVVPLADGVFVATIFEPCTDRDAMTRELLPSCRLRLRGLEIDLAGTVRRDGSAPLMIESVVGSLAIAQTPGGYQAAWEHRSVDALTQYVDWSLIDATTATPGPVSIVLTGHGLQPTLTLRSRGTDLVLAVGQSDMGSFPFTRIERLDPATGATTPAGTGVDRAGVIELLPGGGLGFVSGPTSGTPPAVYYRRLCW